MTKNLFDFNLQLFDLPETPTVSASENNVVVEGADTVVSGASEVTETDAEILEAIEALYAPKENDEQELNDITYTFDGENWTYESTTTKIASDELEGAIIDANYNPVDGDTQMYNDVIYTYSAESDVWTYQEDVTATLEDSDTLAELASIYAPINGQEVTLNDVVYTYDEGSWVYLNSETVTLSDEEDDEVEAAYVESVVQDGDEQVLNDITYTYNGENWTYEVDATDTAAAEIVSQIVDEYYSPAESDTQELDGITYTYTNGEWTYETDTTDIAAAEIVSQIVDEYYSPAESDTQELDGITYTYTNGEWIYETDTTDIATAEIAAAIIDEYYSPAESDTQPVDGTEYTYINGEWTYLEEATSIEAAISDAFIAENRVAGATANYEDVIYTYDGSNWLDDEENIVQDGTTIAGIEAALIKDGSTVRIDGITYTYNDISEEWEYAETVVVTDAGIIEALAEYYTPSEDDEQELDGINYTYNGTDWTYDTTANETASAEIVSQIIDEYYSPDADDSQELDNITYTYNGTDWTYDTTANETASAEIVAAIIDEYYSPEAEDEQVLNDITYTYNGTEWTYETTATENASDEIVAAIIDEYYSPEAEDTVDIDDVTYTFNGESWTYENSVELTADSDTAAAILATLEPQDGTEQEIGGITYTYDADSDVWTFVDIVTEIADTSTALAIDIANYLPSDGDVVTYEDVEYTFHVALGAENPLYFSYEETTEETADSDTVAAIIAEYYSPEADDEQIIDGTAYTYDGENWTHEVDVTVTSYYQFSDSVSSNDAPVTILEAETSSDTENTSIAAPAFINGNGEDFVVDGVGTVSGLEDGETFVVTADDDKISAVAVNGDIELTPADKDVSLAVNNAQLNYSAAGKGTSVELTAEDASLVTVQADGAVTLKSIDTNQAWLLNDSSDTAITFKGVNLYAHSEIYATAADSDGSAISVYDLDEGEHLVVSGKGSNANDKIVVNGVSIEGAAKANASITALEDSLAVIVGDAATVAVNGTNANLAADAFAIIVGEGSNASIDAVSELAPNGKLVTDQSEITVGDEIWSFNGVSNAVTLTADASSTSIAKLAFDSGTAAVNSAFTDADGSVDIYAVNVNNKASWALIGTDDDFEDFAAFDANGNATLAGSDRDINIAALTSGKNLTLTTGNTGDVLTLSKGSAVIAMGDDAVGANSLAAGGSWTVKSEYANLGDYALVTEDVDSNATRAVITADKSKGDVVSSIQGLSGNATLAYTDDASINGLTVGSTTWTIKNAAVEEITVPGTVSGEDSVISSSELFFNADGDVTVAADSTSTLEVSALSTADSGAAVVNVTGSGSVVSAKLNGVNVDYYGNPDGVSFTLEDKAHNAGIAAISSVNDFTFLDVSGDSLYTVNQFTFANSARASASFIVHDDSLALFGTKNGDAVTISGGEGVVRFAEAEKSSSGVAC